ncbi:MAG TPA: serine/threonine-protein kinase [Burkholderiales bacterium]|nr:serine/threonine-protein kinase [Burkholderiales bacterium]
MIPHALGRYKILAELGRGAMGIVYKAHDPVIQRDVAVKVLHPDCPPEELPEVRERFLREARSAGRLSHPAIVVIHDVGESDDGTAYIAMELLQGESLKAALARPARMPLDVVTDLAAQIADSLDYAQRHEIVHRDVKPANIMVTGPSAAKLTDFGIAYVSSSGTQTEMLGSPKYMSPEQVKGEALDGRSDIFSLGVVLYEMLTRRTPFERATDASVYPLMQRIVAAPHERPTEIDPNLPRGFDVILARALAKEPGRRYQRGAEFAADLRKFGALLSGDQEIRVPAAPAGAAHAGGTAPAPAPNAKSGVLGMLRQKAEADARAQSAPDVSPEAIDTRMRAAFRYLNALGTEMKAARPTCQRRFDVIFLGTLPEFVYTAPFVDYRTRPGSESALCERILFNARVETPEPVRIDLVRDEIPLMKKELERLQLKYECTETKNDFGVVMRARFTIAAGLPVNAELRADYSSGIVNVDLRNVGIWGSAKLQLPIAELDDDWLEEFSKLLLGMESRLVVKPASKP